MVISVPCLSQRRQLPLQRADAVHGCLPVYGIRLDLPGVPMLLGELLAFKCLKAHLVLLGKLSIRQTIAGQAPPILGGQQQAQLFIDVSGLAE